MGQGTQALLAVLLLLMLAQGSDGRGVCYACLLNIEISQAVVHVKIDPHNTVFKVTVTNGCCCTVKNVAVVASTGFQSALPLDPKMFRWDGQKKYYVVHDGATIPRYESVTFMPGAKRSRWML